MDADSNVWWEWDHGLRVQQSQSVFPPVIKSPITLGNEWECGIKYGFNRRRRWAPFSPKSWTKLLLLFPSSLSASEQSVLFLFFCVPFPLFLTFSHLHCLFFFFISFTISLTLSFFLSLYFLHLSFAFFSVLLYLCFCLPLFLSFSPHLFKFSLFSALLLLIFSFTHVLHHFIRIYFLLLPHLCSLTL